MSQPNTAVSKRSPMFGLFYDLLYAHVPAGKFAELVKFQERHWEAGYFFASGDTCQQVEEFLKRLDVLEGKVAQKTHSAALDEAALVANEAKQALLNKTAELGGCREVSQQRLELIKKQNLEITELRQAIKGLQKDIGQVRQDYELKIQQNSQINIQERAAAASKEDDLKKRVQNLQEVNFEIRAENDRLRTQSGCLATLTAKRDALVKDREDQRSCIEGLLKESTELKENNLRQVVVIQDLKAECNLLKKGSDANEQRVEILRLRREVKILNGRLDEKKAEFDEATAAVNKNFAAILEYRQTIVELNQRDVGQKAVISNLESRLEDSHNERSAQEITIRGLREKSQARTFQGRELLNDIQTLRDKLLVVDASEKSFREAYHKMRNAYSHTNQELSALVEGAKARHEANLKKV